MTKEPNLTLDMVKRAVKKVKDAEDIETAAKPIVTRKSYDEFWSEFFGESEFYIIEGSND